MDKMFIVDTDATLSPGTVKVPRDTIPEGTDVKGVVIYNVPYIHYNDIFFAENVEIHDNDPRIIYVSTDVKIKGLMDFDFEIRGLKLILSDMQADQYREYMKTKYI